jgi:hypothetical protein
VKFVSGERDEVTLASGRLSWLPTPSAVRLVMRAPETTFSEDRPGHVAIRVKWGFASAHLVARVDEDGELVMDTSDVPSFLGLRAPIEDWVTTLNDHLRDTGRRLEPAEIRGDALTLRASSR